MALSPSEPTAPSLRSSQPVERTPLLNFPAHGLRLSAIDTIFGRRQDYPQRYLYRRRRALESDGLPETEMPPWYAVELGPETPWGWYSQVRATPRLAHDPKATE